jgi:hypothetical protein
MKTRIGIDPGASGGIAWQHGDAKACAVKMPDTAGDLIELLRDIQFKAEQATDDCEAHVELVGGFIGKRQPGSAMFKFGKGAGVIEGALMALGVRVLLHRPQAWQKTFSLGTASQCATSTVWKNKLKAEAQRRFPHLKVTNATADALLILEHGRAK